VRVLSVGEILWDIFPDQERLGGAALNFSANTARLGNSATLMTAVGDDARGRAALEIMHQLGLTTDCVHIAHGHATGVAQVGVNASGDPRFEIPRPAAFDQLTMTPDLYADALRNKSDWLYFGTLMQTEPHIERMIEHLGQTLPGIRCFYDINLREGHWNLPLVERLCRLTSVLKMNEQEARILARLSGISPSEYSLTTFCKVWAKRFDIDTICVTLGEAGCYVYSGGEEYNVPGYATIVEDTVGAGDAFAAAFLHGLNHHWPIERIAHFANALGSIVASKAGATPDWSIEECFMVAGISSGEIADS
jgi:fructokinase